MTRKEKLRDNYEDALFALLMESVMEEEGKKLLQENERLKADPEFEVPEEASRRCVKAIKKAFAKKNGKAAGKAIYRTFSKVAVLAVLCGLLFTAAYAAIPDVRVKTLNLLIETSDVTTRLTIAGEGSAANMGKPRPGAAEGGVILLRYQFPDAPEGFVQDPTQSGVIGEFAWAYYQNEDGATVEYVVHASPKGSPLDVDTEGADLVLDIMVQGHAGMLVKKGNRTDIAWADMEHNAFCSIIFTNCDPQPILELASDVTFLGTE